MSVSGPSEAAINDLLAGQELRSGKLVVGPLGPDAVRLLRTIWTIRDELSKGKGAEQVNTLRRAYRKDAATAPAADGEDADPTRGVPRGPLPSAKHFWRLHKLKCQSIRGLAPAGTPFEFHYDGVSLLIYGPNGSGKTSLLNAVAWVLTGRVSTDADEEADAITLYAPPKANGKPSKLCDWPIVHTLPAGDPDEQTPNCHSEILLRAKDGSRSLYLRRSLQDGLQESDDGTTWRPCASLLTHGITPLDVQLSISAATAFAKRCVETASDTRVLLSMMLGYDTLEELGAMLTPLATTLTRVGKAEREAVADRTIQIRDRLAALPPRLREGHPLREDLASLMADDVPRTEQITEVHKRVLRAVKTAEVELVTLLGVEPGASEAGLAEDLTAAVALLDKPLDELFPTLPALHPSEALPEDSGVPDSERVAAIEGAFRAFEQVARKRVQARLAWWRKESESGSKVSHLMQAALHYDPAAHVCPTCGQDIRHHPVEAELRGFKDLDSGLRADLRSFFRDLADELLIAVPESVSDLSEMNPTVGLRCDWDSLRHQLGLALGPVVAPFDADFTNLLAELPPVSTADPNLMPADAEEEFAKAAEGFLTKLRAARDGLAVLRWAVDHLPKVTGQLHDRLTAREADCTSLRAALGRGKDAALDAMPLAGVRDALAEIARDTLALSRSADDLATLDAMREALDEIKPLGKYAGAEVERIFDAIRDDTIENFRKLYPLSNPDLALTRLHLHHGRDKRVEAYVTGPGGEYEVPSQYVGNAASLRAVALAFFFALLTRHPGGLGFVLMDDPILSLDDDHREAWSANVLRASLGSTQVILATHQRQFFNNCRSDFRPGRLIELNPRNRRPEGGRRLTFRPGDRLERAEEIFDLAVSSVPNEMRKYREDLLSTLDTYSPDPIFIAGNWKRSLETYTALKAPHILASSNQQNIAKMLNDPKVTRVLDAGSHAATEGNVSEAMIHDCLQVLIALDVHFRKELDRLDAILLRNLRSKGPPPEPLDIAAAAPTPVSADKPAKPIKLEGGAATWTKPVRLKLIGKAAAQTQGCVVDLSEEPWWAELPPGAAVLVVAETICPVARPGQWVLLDEPTEEIRDGDLVAGMDRSRNAYLRRAWSVGDLWSLAPVNPLAGVGPVNVRKCEAELRKVRGIMYAPKTHPAVRTDKGVREWMPHGAFSAAELSKHYGIKVTGTSLAPIAVDGQYVIVGPKVDRRLEGITGGSLAVVETADERVGNVIKRVFPREKDWLLVSPNPIEPREPIAVAVGSIRAVWPVRGVLLNAREIDRYART